MAQSQPQALETRCDFCGAWLRVVHFDFGIDPDTGYCDAGDYIECPDCNFREEL